MERRTKNEVCVTTRSSARVHNSNSFDASLWVDSVFGHLPRHCVPRHALHRQHLKVLGELRVCKHRETKKTHHGRAQEGAADMIK